MVCGAAIEWLKATEVIGEIPSSFLERFLVLELPGWQFWNVLFLRGELLCLRSARCHSSLPADVPRLLLTLVAAESLRACRSRFHFRNGSIHHFRSQCSP